MYLGLYILTWCMVRRTRVDDDMLKDEDRSMGTYILLWHTSWKQHLLMVLDVVFFCKQS